MDRSNGTPTGTSRLTGTIYLITIIFTLNKWFTEYIPLNFNNTSDIEAAFLDLNLSIRNDTVSTKTYDKRHDFYFDIVNFRILDGDVPRRPSHGAYET